MALKLMDPVYNQMPFFQPNQVLTYNHLNDLAGYLYQQERYTRNKLIGSGIVCGLSFSWTAAGPNAQVLIDEGCALTSAGYLIVFKQPVSGTGALVPYTHKRNFTRLKDIEPFKSIPATAAATIHELITLDQFNAEPLPAPAKSILLNTDKTGMVLILLFDLQALNVAKCLDESCDDKGKIYDFTPRPLLVPVAIIDAILTANSTKSFFTEPGRSHKGKESVLFELDYLFLKNLFKANNLENVNSPADLLTLLKAPCLDPELNTIRTAIDNLIIKFPWIFNTQFNCMKAEFPALVAQTLGTLFRTNSQNFRNTAGNNNYMQYLYDFLRDVVDGYNELFSAVSELVSECGGNEFIYPFHVMLGLPQTNDTLACYKEEKYAEHNFKYRHYFVPSPIMDEQFMLYENVQNLFKRLVRVIANFSVNQADVIIKVTPSKDYNVVLGKRAVPYYYLQAATENIKRVWDYDTTKRNKISRIKGYQLTFTQDQLLDEDTSKNDFFRVEGHIGSTASAAITAIDILRKKYNLPFAVSKVSIQPQTNTITCAFPDLEEEYNFYRDRVQGYLREIFRWFDLWKSSIGTDPDTKPFFDKIFAALQKMYDILSAKCIENFDYNSYKRSYVEIWNTIFEAYVKSVSSDISDANQMLNSISNLFNIIFFKPIYKIWYMYKYRIALITQSQVNSLKLLAAKKTGLEHLAGVRKGDTLLLVSDTTQGDKVIADFNYPGVPDCGCDCKPANCNENHKSLVSPLQKPIIMVVDYEYKSTKNLFKHKAVLDPGKEMYILELDEMGFYKADSSIQNEVRIFDEDGNTFPQLKGIWQDKKLILGYFTDNNIEKDGFYKLFYELQGDFDEAKVVGQIFLFVIGRIKVTAAANVDVPVGGKLKGYYPYDKMKMRKVKPDMEFEGKTRRRTIGDEKVDVYTTEKGNEFGIFYDRSGLPFVKIIQTKSPGVEEIPVMISTTGSSSKGYVNINIIDKADKMEADILEGKVMTGDGEPIRDVKITSSNGREIITNEKGEYMLKGIKDGEVITLEKKGYKTIKVQANSTLKPEFRLEKQGRAGIKGFEGIKLPEGLRKYGDTINFNLLKKLME